MIGLLIAVALIPQVFSACDMVYKPVQMPDANIAWVETIRDRYGCEIEHGQHRYNPRDDGDLRRLRAVAALHRSQYLRQRAKDMK